MRKIPGFIGLFIIIVIGKYVIVAQSAVTGTWRADARAERSEKADAGKIHLSFERRTDSGHNQHGSDFAYSDLQGLSHEQARSGGSVNFRLVREAGTVECAGTFENGKGSGTFTFTPSASYVQAMRSRGFDFERPSKHKHHDVDGRLLSAALIDVTTALADDIRSNFADADVDDLFKAAIFKIDSRFMAEMKATGFPGLDMEDLVKARIFKIDADYVRQVREMGFSEKNFEGLVKFRIFKVTPEFLAELRAEGFATLDAEDVVKFRIFHIDRDFIRRAKAENPNVTVEQLVRMKIGVHSRSNDDD